MTKKRRSGGRNKPAGARGHVSGLRSRHIRWLRLATSTADCVLTTSSAEAQLWRFACARERATGPVLTLLPTLSHDSTCCRSSG